ncbi:MAG: hypothetical protein ACK5PP_08965 [Acidimicrobiales bacterium]
MTPVTDRPLGALGLIDGAFAVIRYRPRTVFLGLAWILVPAAVIRILLSRRVGGNDPFGAGTALGLFNLGSGAESTLIAVLDLVVAGLAGLPMALLVNAWFQGRDPGPWELTRQGLGSVRYWVIPFALTKMITAVGALLLPVLIVPLVFFSVASPVVAVERTGPLATLRRCRDLVNGHLGQGLKVYLLAAVVSTIGRVSVLAVALLPDTLPLPWEDPWLIGTAGNLLAFSVITPFNAAAMALLYLDLRFRREGIDLTRRAATAFATARPEHHHG